MSDDIDINAALELSQNVVDAARTTMQAARKLQELATVLKLSQSGGWLPASVPPATGIYVIGLYLRPNALPAAWCVVLQHQSNQWYDREGERDNPPDYWCHLPMGVIL